MLRRPATRAATLVTRRWSSTTSELGFFARWSSEISKWITMEKGGQEKRRASRGQPTRDQNFDHEKWSMHKDPRRHVRHFVTWGYSAATQRILFPDLALIFSTSTALTAYNCLAEVPMYMPPEPIVLPSVALGLLITFRTNTANMRYNEARCLWGEIVNTSRDITRIALQWMPQSKDDAFGKAQAAKVCRMTKAFSIVLKYHLTIDGGSPDGTRLEVERDDLIKGEGGPILKKELRDELIKYCFDPNDPEQLIELDRCVESSHRPLWTIQQMCTASHAGIWARCGDRPDRAIRDAHLLERHFQRLCGAMGACERVHKTPIPTAFTRHSSRFLTVWCNAMPLVLWPIVGNCTPLAAVFVSWAMLGTEDIGVQVEEPFDVLPLFQYTQGIAATCDGMAKDAKAEQITLSLDLDVERTGPQILANGYADKFPTHVEMLSHAKVARA